MRRSIRRWLAAAGAASLWALFWLTPWLGLVPSPAARAALAVVLLSVPGWSLQSWLDPTPEASLATRLPQGLAVTIALTGVLGFVGSLLQLPTASVDLGLLVAGAVTTAIAVATRVSAGTAAATVPPASDAAQSTASPATEPPTRRRPSLAAATPQVIDALVLGAALVLVAGIAFRPHLSGDDLTYAARIAAFAQRPRLGFERIVFDAPSPIPPRYWLAYWSLGTAIVGAKAGLQAFELLGAYLVPPIAVLALLAVYGLARSLGMRRRLAVLAVIAQAGALLLLARGRYQPGYVFFYRVTEDKFLAIFLLTPCALAAIVRHWTSPSPGRLVAVALSWLALLLTHPTSLGMAFLVVALFAALEVAARGAGRAVLATLAVIVPLTAAAAAVRLIPHPYQEHVFFDVKSAVAEGETFAGRLARIDTIGDGAFYGVSGGAAPPLARKLGLVALGATVLAWRRSRPARYVVAALVIAAAAIVPYTGWLLGRLLTPFHLWRITGLVPFGIATALLLSGTLRALSRRPIFASTLARVPLGAISLIGALGLLCALDAFRPLPPPELAGVKADELALSDESITVRCSMTRKAAHLRLSDLAAIAGPTARLIGEHAAAVGDLCIHDLIPGLAAGARLTAFRTPSETVQHAGVSLAEATRRLRERQALVRGNLPPDEMLRYFADNEIQWVLVSSPPHWLDKLPEDALRRQRVASAGPLELYRVQAVR